MITWKKKRAVEYSDLPGRVKNALGEVGIDTAAELMARIETSGLIEVEHQAYYFHGWGGRYVGRVGWEWLFLWLETNGFDYRPFITNQLRKDMGFVKPTADRQRRLLEKIKQKIAKIQTLQLELIELKLELREFE